jgi:hypothetical protein
VIVQKRDLNPQCSLSKVKAASDTPSSLDELGLATVDNAEEIFFLVSGIHVIARQMLLRIPWELAGHQITPLTRRSAVVISTATVRSAHVTDNF